MEEAGGHPLNPGCKGFDFSSCSKDVHKMDKPDCLDGFAFCEPREVGEELCRADQNCISIDVARNGRHFFMNKLDGSKCTAAAGEAGGVHDDEEYIMVWDMCCFWGRIWERILVVAVDC